MCVERGSEDKCPHCGAECIELSPYFWGMDLLFKCCKCGHFCDLNLKTGKYEKLDSYTEKELRKKIVGACIDENQK